MKHPHKEMAKEFHSDPEAYEWTTSDIYPTKWLDGAKHWPKWRVYVLYTIRRKSQKKLYQKRTEIPRPLTVEPTPVRDTKLCR